MKILLIGDVFASPGRKTVKDILPSLKVELEADLVIANAENLHHGKGVSSSKITELQKAGVDFFTSGNHIWKVNEIFEYMNKETYPLIRPANYPKSVPGRGHAIIETKKGEKVMVINLIGRVFMHTHTDCPFRTAEAIIEMEAEKGWKLGDKLAAIVVDMHAEVGSEKMALGHFLDGKVSAVVGTHTHIPTADEQILPGGTAYQTDLGMTGVVNSIIGVNKTEIIENFLTQMPVRHQIAEGPTVFNALLIETDPITGLTINIKRIQKYQN